MPASGSLPRRTRAARAHGEAAFTLVEVAAAVAVLVASVLAGTGLVVLASRHTAVTERRVAERDAALELLWNLERLPYVAEAGAPSVTTEAFPHALAARNTEDAFYVAQATGGLPAGCFATRRRIAGREFLVVARFLMRDELGAWRGAGDGEVCGKDFTVDEPPPVLRVEVRRAGVGLGAVITGRVYAADLLARAEEQ